MRDRTDQIRKVCEENARTFDGSESSGDSEFAAGRFIPTSLTVAEAEGLTWCRMGKVGTHAWAALFLLFKGLGVQKIKVNFAFLLGKPQKKLF